MSIQNFQQGVRSASVVASTAADGILRIKLSGGVGPDKPISVKNVSRKLEHRDFRGLQVEITSTGGCSNEAFLIYDLLRAQPVPVATRAIGDCFSAAVVIFMAGDLRLASVDAEFLLHPASLPRDTLPESVTCSILRAHAAQLGLTDARLADLFSSRTGWPFEWFLKEASTEETLSTSDAITTGLVHDFDGVTIKVDSSWLDLAPLAAAQRQIYFPPHLFTENYFAACRCSAAIYGKVNS